MTVFGSRVAGGGTFDECVDGCGTAARGRRF